MVHQPQQAEEKSLSLRHRIRRFWIEEGRLIRIVRSVLLHAVIALPLEAFLLWLGCPVICAFLVAVSVAVTVEVVSLKSETKDQNS